MLKQRLAKFFLRDTHKWHFWVLFAFICKGLLFAFLIFRDKGIAMLPGFNGIIGGDTGSYIIPINNLIAHGSYTPDFRMPGYGALYMPFALLFNTLTAYNILIACQFIMAALSVYPLALIAKQLFKSNKMFYLTFYLFAFSIYSDMFDTSVQTESFAVSFLILSVFFFLRAIEKENRRILNLFLSGLLLSEVAFLRNVFLIIPLLFCIVLSVALYKQIKKKKLFVKLLVFVSPFLLMDGAWTARNYIKHHKLLPATTTINYPAIMNAYYIQLYALVYSWGGSDQIGEPHADATWFFIGGKVSLLPSTNVSLPKYIYTSKFNYDSLVVLRKQLAVYIATEGNTAVDSTPEMKSRLAVIRAKFLLYAKSVKEENPFLYYVIAPLNRTKIFLIHSGTYNLFHASPSQLNPLCYSIKVLYSVFYLLILGLGAIGLFLLAKQSIQFKPIVLITGIVIYIILIHPIILGTCEMRYFVPAYPFMLICAAYAVGQIQAKLQTKR